MKCAFISGMACSAKPGTGCTFTRIFHSVKKLKKKEILVGIIAPFLPNPLIDNAIVLFSHCWINRKYMSISRSEM